MEKFEKVLNFAKKIFFLLTWGGFLPLLNRLKQLCEINCVSTLQKKKWPSTRSSNVWSDKETEVFLNVIKRTLNGKWTVFIQRFSSLFDYSKCFTTQVSIHPFIHTHTFTQVTSLYRSQVPDEPTCSYQLIHTHIHTPMAQPWEQFGFRYLA